MDFFKSKLFNPEYWDKDLISNKLYYDLSMPQLKINKRLLYFFDKIIQKKKMYLIDSDFNKLNIKNCLHEKYYLFVFYTYYFKFEEFIIDLLENFEDFYDLDYLNIICLFDKIEGMAIYMDSTYIKENWGFCDFKNKNISIKKIKTELLLKNLIL